MSLRRPMSSAVVLILGVAPMAFAQGIVMAWTRVERTTVDSGAGRPAVVRVSRTVTADGRVRMEQLGGADTATPRMVMITDSAAHTLLSLMPAQHMAMLMEYPGKMMENMRDGLPLKPVGKPEHHTEELGAGPRILDHATTHYRTTSHAVLHFSAGEVSCNRTMDTRSEVWTAPDSAGPPTMHPVAAPAVGQGLVPSFDSTAVAELRKVRGVPLRTESVATVATDNGAPSEVRTLTEVTQLTHAPVDTALFVAPAGYHLMDQRKMMAAIDQKKMYEAMAPMMGEIFCKGRVPAAP